MMTSSNGNIFRVTGPLCGEFTGPGEFTAQRPVTRGFDVFFDMRPNKRLRKQPWGWWLETPFWSLWRQCNAIDTYSANHNLGDVFIGCTWYNTFCWFVLRSVGWQEIRTPYTSKASEVRRHVAISRISCEKQNPSIYDYTFKECILVLLHMPISCCVSFMDLHILWSYTTFLDLTDPTESKMS